MLVYISIERRDSVMKPAATSVCPCWTGLCTWCRYTIPGGSAGHFQRKGFIFDVGSSMMFGMGQKGTTNLITRALAAVGKSLETAPDPTQIHYHLPRSQAHPQVPLLACFIQSSQRLLHHPCVHDCLDAKAGEVSWCRALT